MIESLSTLSECHDELVDLLNNCVENGASIGFLAPLECGEASLYWQGVAADIAGGKRTLLVARASGRIAGTVQISYCAKKNGRHRADVEKLMVHTAFRQQGIAWALMAEVERQALADRRTLLVLDTRTGDPASLLYRKAGYQEAGQIPGYALNANGTADSTTLFYKML